MVVRFADLNLQSARDADILAHRLARAAFRTCGGADLGALSVREAKALSLCTDDAMSRAALAIRSPALNAALLRLHQSAASRRRHNSLLAVASLQPGARSGAP